MTVWRALRVRRVKYVLIGVLYAVLALFVAVGFAGKLGPLEVPSLLIAASVIALVLVGLRSSDRRVERKRLMHAHGLSGYDARMAMHLVDSGQVMRAALRPAGRNYAERELDRGPTPVWVPALGVVLAVVVYLPYAGLPGARVFAFVGIGVVGFRCHRLYTRPARLRSVPVPTGAPELQAQPEAPGSHAASRQSRPPLPSRTLTRSGPQRTHRPATPR